MVKREFEREDAELGTKSSPNPEIQSWGPGVPQTKGVQFFMGWQVDEVHNYLNKYLARSGKWIIIVIYQITTRLLK